jgi:hypothetical protein
MFLLIVFLHQLTHVQPHAAPYIGRIDPPVGPDDGGYIITISGRNLGFLDIDCTVKFGNRITSTKVTDSWDTLETIAPSCPMCGKVDVSVMCGGTESNKVPFVTTNKCFGPVKAGNIQALPSRFSARENCTVCVDLVQLTMAAVADKTSYQGIQSAMQTACYTTHFKKWLNPEAPSCELDLQPACRLLLATSGDILVDTIWNVWDDAQHGYWNGELPNTVCSRIQKCLPGAMFRL